MGRIRIKRRHTEEHPEVYATMNGKIRNAILKFISDKGGKCTLDEYSDYTKALKTKLKLGYQPKGWYKANEKYVSSSNIDGVIHLKLTRIGNNLVNLVINEI